MRTTNEPAGRTRGFGASSAFSSFFFSPFADSPRQQALPGPLSLPRPPALASGAASGAASVAASGTAFVPAVASLFASPSAAVSVAGLRRPDALERRLLLRHRDLDAVAPQQAEQVGELAAAAARSAGMT